MISIKKKILGILIVVGMVNAFTVLADNPIDEINQEIRKLEEKLKNQRSDIDSIRNTMGKVEEEIEEMEIEIEKIDYQREKLQESINDKELEINELETQIEVLKEKIAQKKEELKKQKELFTNQVRYMYTRGLTGQLEALFSADSFESFMSYFTFNNKLNNRNSDLKDSIQNNIEFNEKGIEEIKVSKRKIELAKAEVLKKKAEKDEQLRVQTIAVDELKKKKNEYNAVLRRHNIEMTNTQKAINSGLAEIERIKLKALQNKNSGKSDGTPTGEDIVALASKFLGQPYLWGGTKPYTGKWGTGFDCSGLVQYCYKQYGITTGRTTYDQIDHPNGIYVKRENLQVGDLVFFGTKWDPHHVGIYIGNNKYLHAPRTGDVIKVSPMTRKDYLEGRRFIKK